MMRVPSTAKYLRECRAVEKEVWAQPDNLEDSRRRAAVSANLFNLLPGLPVAEHSSAAKRILIAERMAVVDQRYCSTLVPPVRSGSDAPDLSGGPAIFCSYHLGPYRLAVPYLVSLGVELTVVIDKNVVQQQGSLFQEVMKQFCKDQHIPVANCQWRDTSEGGLLLSLIRDIKKGRSVLFYIDGNTSVNADVGARDKNALPVDFMGARLFARAGVATLAHMTKSRIMPVLMKRDLDDQVPISAEIRPPYEWAGDDRATYVKDACSWMWKVLEDEIVRDPFVWEPWRYVHRFIDIDAYEQVEKDRPAVDFTSVKPSHLTFDKERFAVAGSTDESYLFDRKLYKFYPVTLQLRKILEDLHDSNHAISSMERGLLRKLVSMRLLTESGLGRSA